MLKILVLIVLIKLSSCINNEELTKFTSNIIRQIFESQCLFYVTKGQYDLKIIYQAIHEVNVSLIKINFDYTEAMICNGYVLVSNSYKDLADIFIKGKYNLKFKANTRVLVFLTKKQIPLQKYYEFNTNIYACDIFVVDGYPTYFHKEKLFTAKLISIRNESVIMKWNINNNFSFNEANFGPITTKEWDLNLLNRNVTASMFNCPPYISYNTETGKFEGMEADILQEVFKKNFLHYKVYNTNNTETNLYEDMIDDMTEGYSDLIMCMPWLDGKHPGKVEISFTYTQQCITFFVPKPHALDQSTFIFRPITVPLAACIIFSGFLTALTYSLISRYQIKVGIVGKPFEHIWAVIFELLRILTLRQAAKTFLTIYDFTRIMVVCWTFFSLLMTTIYSSGLSTFMTYPPLTGGFDTFKDIANGNIEWGGLGEDSIDVFLEHSNPIFKKIAKLYSENLTISIINTKLQQEKNVAIYVKTLPSKYIHSENLQELDESSLNAIKMIPKCATLYLVGFALAPNSPYLSYVNSELSKYLEHGLISYWYTKMNTKSGVLKRLAIFHKTYNPNELSPSQIVLQLDELQGAFVLLICGWAIAVVGFICETLYWKYKNHN